MGADLVDIDGQQIRTDEYYKIQFSDGTEVGMGALYNSRVTSSPRGSNGGAVIRYRRVRPDDSNAYGWPADEVGYIKGLMEGSDGRIYARHLSLSEGVPSVLAWYETDDSYGFVAKQTPGNRLALYAYDQNNSRRGLRVVRDGDDLRIIEDTSGYSMALDCAFVKVATLEKYQGDRF